MTEPVLTLPASLPYGFIFIKDLISSYIIIENLRYASFHNFVGRPIARYSPKCSVILTVSAIEALSQAVAQLRADGYSLVIYDAYRPKKAVDDFIQWSENGEENEETKARYYPNVNKKDLFDRGYLSKKSDHSSGSTLDATIIASGNSLRPIKSIERQLSDGRCVLWLDDGSVDMGTSFDFFDEASGHESPLVGEDHNKMRSYFRGVMQQAGFVCSEKQWWHYTLKGGPFEHLSYDFDLESSYEETVSSPL